MTFIPAAGVAEVRLTYLADGHALVNILHFRVGAEPTNLELGALGDNVVAWWRSSLSQYLSNELTLTGCDVRDIGREDGLIVSATVNLPSAGGVNSEIYALNCALVVTGRTGVAGRSYRSRTYVPGLPESAVHGNEYTLALQGNVQASFNELVTSGVFASNQPVVVSRRHNKLPRATAVVTDIITYQVRNQVVGTQRRRAHRT